MSEFIKLDLLNPNLLKEVSKFGKREVSKLSYYSKTAKKIIFDSLTIEALEELMEDRRVKFYVAHDKKIEGIAYGFKENKDTLYICWVLISPKYRRKNLGSYLLNELVSSIKSKKVIADIRTTNKPSQKFFMANGFKYLEDVEHMGQKYRRYENNRSSK